MTDEKKSADCRQAARQTERELDYRQKLKRFIADSPIDSLSMMEHFPVVTPRQATARYLALYEVFKKITPIQGDIIQGGVHWGGSLMGFAQFSALLEPYNLQRKIIGFDTFEGFTDLSEKDIANQQEPHTEATKGGYKAESETWLSQAIQLHDSNRPLGHIEKVQLIRGDATETIPLYLQKNPHTIVALLHLDFDLYEPTRVALENILPRMPKGAAIIFDELNHPAWPGETQAVLESLDINKAKIERFPFEPFISYCILE